MKQEENSPPVEVVFIVWIEFDGTKVRNRVEITLIRGWVGVAPEIGHFNTFLVVSSCAGTCAHQVCTREKF